MKVHLPLVPFGSSLTQAGSGSVDPRPLTEWHPFGSFSIYSAAFSSCLRISFKFNNYENKIYRNEININHRLHVSKRHFTKQKQSTTIIRSRKAVISRFGHHIGKVDTLAEHVASDWCFGRGDSQPLWKNTGVVRETRTVPKKLPVFKLAEGLKKSKRLSIRLLLLPCISSLPCYGRF